ncbi:MAG: MCE family protein [Candidatus Zixiibacteriota bacterium]|nr:MAG: MCE family protein [candidate division Zixibacteria bacterium]
MKKSYSELRVGLTVLLATVIVVSVILWGKGYSLSAQYRDRLVRFDDVAGLEEGAFVLVNGLRKGRVAEFILEQRGVLVRLSLNDRVKLYTDARFEITSPELMGAKVVNIQPGISGRTPPADTVFYGESGGGMNELLKMSTDLAGNVDSLLDVLQITINNINKTAGDPRVQEAFLSAVRNLDQSTEHTLELIRINEGKLTEVMNDLVATTGTVRQLVEQNSSEIDNTVDDIHSFVAQMREISNDLDQIVGALRSQDGTLGQLIYNGETITTLNRTLTSVDSLVEEIRESGITTNINLFGSRRK